MSRIKLPTDFHQNRIVEFWASVRIKVTKFQEKILWSIQIILRGFHRIILIEMEVKNEPRLQFQWKELNQRLMLSPNKRQKRLRRKDRQTWAIKIKVKITMWIKNYQISVIVLMNVQHHKLTANSHLSSAISKIVAINWLEGRPFLNRNLRKKSKG